MRPLHTGIDAGAFVAWDGEALLWGGVAVALLLLLGAGLMWLRRRTCSFGQSEGADAGSGFSIGDLESLKASGLLSDEEFCRLRRAALGLDASEAACDNSCSSAPAELDDSNRGADPAGAPADSEDCE